MMILSALSPVFGGLGRSPSEPILKPWASLVWVGVTWGFPQVFSLRDIRRVPRYLRDAVAWDDRRGFA